MKLSDYIAIFLAKRTNHAFVGNGGCVIHILDSLAKTPGMHVVPMENEQGASIAAEAYSRLGGGLLGVAIATSGPGLLNLMQGIACAFFDSIPSFFISGAPPLPHLKGDRKVRQFGFQEMDVVDIVKPITKYAVLLNDPLKVRYELEKLFYFACEGRSGPVLLELPDDLQRSDIDPERLVGFTPPLNSRQSITEDQLHMFYEILSNSERPLAIVGGGVKLAGAQDSMIRFLRETGIPYVPTWATVDILAGQEGLYCPGGFGISSTRGGNFAVQKADLLINFASRIDTHLTGSNMSKFAPNAKIISIDIDACELNKHNDPKFILKINGNIKFFLEKLDIANLFLHDLSKWQRTIVFLQERYPICLQEYYNQNQFVNPYVFMRELSKETADGDIVITDAGATLTWTMQAYAPRKGQMLFSAFNHSPMGYALPASVGAKYASPDKRIICIIGDGGMQMNIQELESVVFNKLPIKIFVIDNGEYGIIKQTQDTWMNSCYVASDPSSGVGFPDIQKIAVAYGFEVCSINNHSELNEVIRKVLESENPMLCDVKVRNGEQIVPKLSYGRPLEDLSPLLNREELELAMRC